MKFAFVILTIALAANPHVVSAQSANPRESDAATLSVSGEGLVERSPDVAHVSLTIVTNDDDATRSAGKNTTILGAIEAKLGALRLGKDAVRTTYFNIEFIPQPPKNLPPQERQPRYGYVTTRTLTVDVAPIENAGKVVDAATSAGVTSVGGVSFDLKDRKGAYQEALVAAMHDAQASASALAKGSDLHIVRILRVSTDGAQPGPIRALRVAGFNATMAAAPPPPTDIAPNGPIDVTARVAVTYEIR